MIVLLRKTGTGCALGDAVAASLAWRGHRVVTAEPLAPASATAAAVTQADAVVDTTPPAGMPAELERLQAAAAAGIPRLIRVAPSTEAARALAEAAVTSGIDLAIVRPTLVIGPHTQANHELAALASHDDGGLPGAGSGPRLQPIHVLEVAEAVAALVERTGKAGGDYELAGRDVVTLRDAVAGYRRALGLRGAGEPGLRDDTAPSLVEVDRISIRNAATVLLGRPPSTYAEALAATPPAPRAAARRAEVFA